MDEFMEAIRQNGELNAKAEELKNRPDSSAADFNAEKEPKDSLTDEELGSVAGGTIRPISGEGYA